MRAAGTDAARIRCLWLLVALICTAATVAGYAIADNVSGNLNAAVDGFAAGALLVMLIDSMIPEAVRKGGDASGLVTVLGFAVATALSSVACGRSMLARVRVLLTGMSGVGKSSLVQELRRRGQLAFDADDDGFSAPRADGRWGWSVERVAELLGRETASPLFFAGCSEEQIELPFDYRVLLTAPEHVLVERLGTRTNNPYGRDGAELSQVLRDRAEVEPLLRRSADLVLTTTAPPAELADSLLARVADVLSARRTRTAQ